MIWLGEMLLNSIDIFTYIPVYGVFNKFSVFGTGFAVMLLFPNAHLSCLLHNVQLYYLF